MLGPLNAPEISKLSVDLEMHLTNDFLTISPSIHCNLGFLGHISNNSENGGPAGKLQDLHRKNSGPLNVPLENPICEPREMAWTLISYAYIPQWLVLPYHIFPLKNLLHNKKFSKKSRSRAH